MPSILDYQGSINISANVTSLTAGNEFYSLFFALLRVADSYNLASLEREFPDLVAEFRARYYAPGGYLPRELER